MTRKVLGKGLSSLIPGPPPPIPATPAPTPYVEIDLDRIDPNPSQPREEFGEESLEELAASIIQHGVVQPVLVRSRAGRYQLVAGERRLRAAQRAGLRRIPAVVREVADEQLLEVALVENLQREELDPIDEAQAYRILIEERGLSHADVAERVGRERSTVSNSLRILSLSSNIQSEIRRKTITAGHARALLALTDTKLRETIARRIVGDGLSVRQVERLAAGSSTRRRKVGTPLVQANDPNTRHAEERLMHALGTRVRIVREPVGGRIEISFHSEEELQRLFEQIVG
jgi:ParB family transcriptional regulator, chromosome partitioning protein